MSQGSVPPTPHDPTRLLTILATLAVAIAGTLGYVIRGDGDGDTTTITRTVPAAPPAVAIDGPDADTKRDDALPLDKAAQQALEDAAEATDKPGDTHTEFAEPLREPSDKAPAGVLEGPLAAQEFTGCRTRHVANFSTRGNTRARVIVWHQTVSRENGWSSQDGLTARANNPESLISWHFLIGRSSGRCTFSVPLHMKAWTASNANRPTFNIEVEAFGDEPAYVTGAGERKLLAVTRELGRRYRIPMQRGRIVFDADCDPTVVKEGIIEHADLGPCGGGHVDAASTGFQRGARPEALGWRIEPLIAKAATSTAIRPIDRTRCRKLTWWRRHGRPHGEPERRAVARRRALAGRRLTCTRAGKLTRA